VHRDGIAPPLRTELGRFRFVLSIERPLPPLFFGTADSKELSGTKDVWGKGTPHTPGAFCIVIKRRELQNLMVVSD
jgi:hypothetical protein